jgi:hypothetical protein
MSYENFLFTEEWEEREFLATVLYLPERKVNVYNMLPENKFVSWKNTICMLPMFPTFMSLSHEKSS